MTRHVTIRFAWHDDKWDGGICKNPERNIYCTGNYSLLSPRLQRRVQLDTEDKHKNQSISKCIEDKGYVPPCYWCINALGKEKHKVEEAHPFSDRSNRTNEWSNVPPIKYNLDEFSIFSWNFKLGYAEKGSYQRYVAPEQLEKRANDYLTEIGSGSSIAFFYANYSNPITADDYKYLLLGAGQIKRTKPPKKYDIPREIIEKIRRQPGMENTPEAAWQFQLLLKPESTFIFPYNDYLSLIEKYQTDATDQWKELDEVAIKIEEKTLIPHFKYVSMHLPHDKAIYLLYSMRQSIRQMKKQEIVKIHVLAEIEAKIKNLLEIAWKERSKYPGFNNLMFLTLKHDFDHEQLEDLLPEIREYLESNYESVENFLDQTEKASPKGKPVASVANAVRILSSNKERVKFLSMFDFTIRQFENVQQIINRLGFETVKKNPYLLLENYNFDFYDTWNVEESDYGIGLYQIDIPLIPDPSCATWEAQHDSRSPERLRALVTKILYDVAKEEGSSYSTRKDIIKAIEKYPLYYINEKLQIDETLLADNEKQMIFKEKFVIIADVRQDDVNYQLKALKEIETIIEQFIFRMLKKKHEIEPDEVDKMLRNEEGDPRTEPTLLAEKRNLFKNCLTNGVFIVSGKAGSGKTQNVANLITQFHEKRSLPVFVFTPTGKANLVVRKRLKDFNLHREKNIRVSTIHRFLYRALSDFYMQYSVRRNEIAKLEDLIGEILDGKLERLGEFKALAKNWTFRPKVVIIDESSMVDDILLAVLLSMINPEALDHLILVGDERQLPPIGVGRPFVDLIYYLKQKGLDENYIHLESSLRFDQTKNIGKLSELFTGQEEPSPVDMEDALNSTDETLQTHFFSNHEELKAVTSAILKEIGCPSTDKPLFDLLADTFENGEELNLDKVQIITPRRIGDYGSMAINQKIILNGKIDFAPRTKLICEENIYFNPRRGARTLGLANGSIGYIVDRRVIYFDELNELIDEFGFDSVDQNLLNQIRTEIYTTSKAERKIDLGYAITVHKAQGSDFEHVILAFSQLSPFITRELLYTALTRPKRKLHFLIQSDLKDNIAQILVKAYSNSSVEQRKTLLFGNKISPFKPYELTLKNGKILEVDSKIERIIARILDQMDIEYEYGPKEFLTEYRIKPDFRLRINDQTYYLEHLGNMNNLNYRERWFRKLPIYKQLGLMGNLVTTSESEEKTDIDENIKRIVENIRNGQLKKTQGYSNHHYEI